MTTSRISGNDVLEQARTATDKATVGRVFGTPVEKDGVLILPVAVVGGGGGGGAGGGKSAANAGDGPAPQEGEGSGGGFGYTAKPAGVYVLKNGEVSWRPAVNVNKIVLGGQLVAVVALLVARSILRRHRRR